MNKKVNRNFQKVIYFYENFYKADLNKKLINLVSDINHLLENKSHDTVMMPCDSLITIVDYYFLHKSRNVVFGITLLLLHSFLDYKNRKYKK